jgi:hypothetical protein
MGFDDPYYNDGIFHDILNVLADEEYFSKVGFDPEVNHFQMPQASPGLVGKPSLRPSHESPAVWLIKTYDQ